MKKRLLSILLTAVLLLSLMPAAVFATTPELHFTITSITEEDFTNLPQNNITDSSPDNVCEASNFSFYLYDSNGNLKNSKSGEGWKDNEGSSCNEPSNFSYVSSIIEVIEFVLYESFEDTMTIKVNGKDALPKIDKSNLYKGDEGYVVDEENLYVAVKVYQAVSIADILATVEGGFPTSAQTGWVNDAGYKAYLDNGYLMIDEIQFNLKNVVTSSENNYIYANGDSLLIFNIESDKLASIEVDGYDDVVDGVYAPLSIGDILPEDFPTSDNNPCYNSEEENSFVYKDNNESELVFGNNTGDRYCISLSGLLVAGQTTQGYTSDTKISYQYENENIKIQFNMKDDDDGSSYELENIVVLNSNISVTNVNPGVYVLPEPIIISTVADILKTNSDFPKSTDSAWKNANGCFVYNTTEELEFNNGSGVIQTILLSTKPTADGSNYKYGSLGDWSITFNMEDGKLVSITFDAQNESLKPLIGTYTAPVPTYTVSVVAGENGTVDLEEITGIVEDTAYTVNGNKLTVGENEITATADEGYEFDCWKIGETVVNTNGTITADTTFTAVFKEKAKTIDDILPDDFPETKGMGWLIDGDTNNNRAYISGTALAVANGRVPLDAILTKNGEKYTITYGGPTFEFNIESNVLKSISYSAAFGPGSGEYIPYTYEIEPTGSKTQGYTGDLVFKTNGSYTNDTDVVVKVDGTQLTLNTDYKVTHGSIEVTLLGDYIKNLAPKTYSISIGVPGSYDEISSQFSIVGVTPVYSGGDDTPTITVPVSGDENSVKVQATVSGSTATVKKIKDADLEKVTEGESVSIDLSAAGKNVDTAKIPTETVEKIAEKSSMTVKLPLAAVEFNKTATEEIVDQAKGSNIELVVDDVKEVSLNAVQKEAVGKLDTAIIIDAHLSSNGSRLCTADNGGFGGGSAKVILPYEIKNNRKPENYSVFYVNEAGKLEKLNAVYDEELKAFVFEIEHFSVYAVAFEQFVDIDANAYYYDAVKWAAENGVTAGMDETHFDPSGITNRAQMVTFLWRVAGKPEPTITKTPFTDLDPNGYYYKAVLWAYENGITDGTGGSAFKPAMALDRAQAVTFFWKYAGKPVVNYWMQMTDVASGQYYTEAVRWALSEKITDGTSKTTFSPYEDCLRGQIVTFLYRYFEK